ncbi:bifunctional adenosylcobinamide kinase/adenosylcobinamide-phosphate guanylyltransferase [Arvimicrobium flavum]|uniref:bifunctional adenosylcobinamide kinase/adenosylcobinamide-phosphate guanylyltransferase n=1 Tax=Arvimicrobium flavum TaxID=3393320 RepID=UPI00237C1FC9|nr:bifunctional adenosylcobinamide kinase/adenosylcobinamide-phosphate guanylyltransferase [Mesorhizobium shangrilense]
MPDGRLTFILGGARSGKSRHAEALIEELPPPWTYVATGQAFDAEMRERIELHKARRDGRWTTLDAPLDLVGVLSLVEVDRPVLVDCLTLWLSNHLLAGNDLDHECAALEAALAHPRGPWFVVSNEVGLGIVPDNALGRRFRDAQGRLNQRIAAIAEEVIFMIAGLPMKVK